MPYLKEAFDPVSLPHAKHISLTPDPTRPHKFEEETDFLIRFIDEYSLIEADSVVLDFGCGMGRVVKKLIDIFGCNVIGIDTSDKMLEYAREYVSDPTRFKTAQHYDADTFDIDVALCCFVLQHVKSPKKEIQTLYQALKPGGYILLLNEQKRFVPSGVDGQGYVIWKDDGISLIDLMRRHFKNVGFYEYFDKKKGMLSLWRK